MNSPIQLVIPAAGAGSRFTDVGISTPKPMIPVGGIPMILWVIGNFNLKSFDTVYIICQKNSEMPKLLEPIVSKLAFSLQYIEIDGITSGPASTVSLALPFLSPEIPIIVANSDQYVSHDLSSFTASVRFLENAGTILTMNASGNKWSYIGRDIAGKISEVVEKREISNEATVGIYAWSSSELLRKSIEYLISQKILVNNEYYIAPSYAFLIASNLAIGVFSVGDHGTSVHGLGTPEDLREFTSHAKFDQFRMNLSLILGISP